LDLILHFPVATVLFQFQSGDINHNDYIQNQDKGYREDPRPANLMSREWLGDKVSEERQEVGHEQDADFVSELMSLLEAIASVSLGDSQEDDDQNRHEECQLDLEERLAGQKDNDESVEEAS